MKKCAYIPQIDSLRAIAVICVLMAHFWPHDFIYRSFQFGRFGVTLFFAISGYLITNILVNIRIRIENGKATAFREILGFYYRRSLRIFPIYYASILLFCALNYHPIKDKIYWHLFYASNFAQGIYNISFGNTSHFWSLCVEEQFYLFIPLIILFLPLKVSWRLLIYCVIFGYLLKVTTAMVFENWLLSTKLPFGNAEGLFFGISIAYAKNFPRLMRKIFAAVRYFFPISILILIVLCVFRYRLEDRVYSNYVYISLIDISFIMAASPILLSVFLQMNNRFVNMVNTKILSEIGKISYGIYVYHYLLAPAFKNYGDIFMIPLEFQPYFNFFTNSLTSIFIAYLSYNFFEKWILKLKEKNESPTPKPEILRDCLGKEKRAKSIGYVNE